MNVYRLTNLSIIKIVPKVTETTGNLGDITETSVLENVRVSTFNTEMYTLSGILGGIKYQNLSLVLSL